MRTLKLSKPKGELYKLFGLPYLFLMKSGLLEG